MKTLIVGLLFYIFFGSHCTHNTKIDKSCPVHFFKIKGMDSCRPFLTCEDIKNMKVIKRLGTGAVKDVFLMRWKHLQVVISVPVDFKLINDFISGVSTLKLLNPSTFVVKFLGYCSERHAVFTEFHPLGNAADFFKSNQLNTRVLKYLDLCHQYAQILNFLHNDPVGKRVLCDSNDLDKLLSQLLITVDQRIILNDVDALPVIVNGSGVKCGDRQLGGSFVAPEQLWPGNGDFDDKLMPAYDEKTDIWKAASVCDFFLKQSREGDVVRYKLFNFHAKCKSHDSRLRPTAEELLKEYKEALNEYSRHFEF